METQIKYDVREVNWPEKTLLTRRVITTFDKLPSFFAGAYGLLYQELQKQGLRSTEPPFAIYYLVDEAKHETDVAAAVAIEGEVKETRGFQKVTIPATKALQLTHYGDYNNMRPAYETLDQYVRDHGFETLLMLEQYFSDPGVEKDPAKWRTDIYFIVK